MTAAAEPSHRLCLSTSAHDDDDDGGGGCRKEGGEVPKLGPVTLISSGGLWPAWTGPSLVALVLFAALLLALAASEDAVFPLGLYSSWIKDPASRSRPMFPRDTADAAAATAGGPAGSTTTNSARDTVEAPDSVCHAASESFCYPTEARDSNWTSQPQSWREEAPPPYHYPEWTAKGEVGNIVVAVLTSGRRQAQSIPAIQDTWGRDFAYIDFFSADAQPGLITKVVPHDGRWARSSWETMNALKVMYEKHPEAPWYYKCDDDAYLNAPQLARLAAHHNSSEPWYFGLALEYPATHDSYCAGGCGYLISNALMKLISGRLLEGLASCCSDVQVGKLVAETTQGAVRCVDPGGFFGQPLFSDGDHPSSAHLHYYSGLPYISTSNGYVPFGTALYNSYAWHYVSATMQFTLRTLFTLANGCGQLAGKCLDRNSTSSAVLPGTLPLLKV